MTDLGRRIASFLRLVAPKFSQNNEGRLADVNAARWNKQQHS